MTNPRADGAPADEATPNVRTGAPERRDRPAVDPPDPAGPPIGPAVGIGLGSLLVFTWMITLGRWDLLATRGFAAMLDVQARAILDGHLWVPEGSLGFEGFIVDGRTYAYFGVFPSLLRIPVFLLTDRFDGRLTTISMILAYVVAYVSTVLLVLRVHRLHRPDGRWSRTGRRITIAFLVTVGIGSNLLHLAAGAWVYHEATLWGVAAVLAAFAAIVGWLIDPWRRHLVTATIWTAVAWTSRGSVGLGPSVALGLLAVATAFPNRFSLALAPLPDRAAGDRRRAAALLGAAAVGAIAFAGVNLAKFGSPTDLPMDRQLQSIHPAPSRAAALEAYGDTIFSPRLIPSVTVQTLRPDLVRPSAVWPWIEFTHRQPPELTAPVFDTVEPSAGLTITHPLAAVLGVIGIIAILRPRNERTPPDAAPTIPPAPGTSRDRDAVPGLAGLRPLLAGALLGTLPVLTIAFISQRYVTDLLPPLFLTAAAGLAVLDRRPGDAAATAAEAPAGPEPTATRPAAAPRFRVLRPRLLGPRLLTGGAVALTVIGVWITLGTTWIHQRFHIPPDTAARVSWVTTVSKMADVIGDRPDFERAASIHDVPATARTLLVIGDCDALYVGQSDGVWSPIETTGAARMPTLRITGRPAVDDPLELLRTDDLRIDLVRPAPDTLRIDLHDGDRTIPGEPFTDPTGPLDLLVDLDGNLRGVHVRHDGRDVAFARIDAPDGPIRIGRGATDITISDIRVPTPACDALTASGDRP